MTHVDLAFSTHDFGYDTLLSDLRKIALLQPTLIHQELQHFHLWYIRTR